jgi:hypothetical protein
MTTKTKQRALQFFKEIQQQFPELSLVQIIPSPEMHRRYWILAQGITSEQRKRELRNFVADHATDILITEGYSFSVKIDYAL